MNSTEFSSLPVPYPEIGYLKITELNKTDVKLLIAEFGEPNKHTSVSDYYKSMRSDLEQLLIDALAKKHQTAKALCVLKKP